MPTIVELDSPLVGGGTAYGCTHMAVWWSLFRRLAAARGYAPGIEQAYGDAANSAGTHLSGTALDLTTADAGLALLAREAGAPAAWPRGAAWGQPYWGDHLHLVIDCPDNTTAAARYQIDAVKAGYDGLGAGGHGGADYIAAPTVWRTVDEGIAWMQGQLSLPVTTSFGVWPGERVGLADAEQIGGTNLYLAAVYDRDGEGMPIVAGEQFVAWAEDALRWRPGDSAVVTWIIRARGAGTLTLTDAVDPTWTPTLPPRLVGSIDVSSLDWVEYQAPAGPGLLEGITSHNPAALGVICTAGTVEIDQVCLQAWPPGGPQGEIVTATLDGQPCYSQRAAVGGTTTISLGRQATVAEAWQHSTEALDGAEKVANGFSLTQVTQLSSVSSVYVFFDADDHWNSYRGEASLQWALLSVRAVRPQPGEATEDNPPGTEGTDWVRRPDRTRWDPDALAVVAGDVTTSWGQGLASVRGDRLDYWGTEAQVPATTDIPAGLVMMLPYIPIPYHRDTTYPYEAHLDGDVILPGGGTPIMELPTRGGGPTEVHYTPPTDQFSVAITSTLDEGYATPIFGDNNGIGVDASFGYYDDVRVDVLPPAFTWAGQITYWRPRWTWQPPSSSAQTSKLRQRQRDDGLGLAPRRWRGASSRQHSNRWKGYR